MKSSLGKLMWLVALVALGLAVVPVPLAIVLSITLFGLGALIAVVAAASGVSRVRASTWVCAAYPWLPLASLYLCWLVAWSSLGHPPRSSVDDPACINAPVSILRDLTLILVIGTGPAAIVGLMLVMYESTLAVEADRPGRPKEVTGRGVIPLLLWLGAILVFAFDPVRVLDWLAD